jgi:hypothetical protein
MKGPGQRLPRLTTQLTPLAAWPLWWEEAYTHGSMEASV